MGRTAYTSKQTGLDFHMDTKLKVTSSFLHLSTLQFLPSASLGAVYTPSTKCLVGIAYFHAQVRLCSHRLCSPVSLSTGSGLVAWLLLFGINLDASFFPSMLAIFYICSELGPEANMASLYTSSLFHTARPDFGASLFFFRLLRLLISKVKMFK